MLTMIPAGIASLIDIGCGAGGFLEELSAERPTLTLAGLEPNSEAAARARSRGFEVIESRFPLDSEPLDRFDCVTFNDVLEHIEDPWLAMRSARCLLRPGGYVVASVPNIANVDTLNEIRKGRFDYQSQGVLDRTHLRFFTAATIQEDFRAAGYEVVRVAGINALKGRRNSVRSVMGMPLSRYLRAYGKYRQIAVVCRVLPDSTES